MVVDASGNYIDWFTTLDVYKTPLATSDQQTMTVVAEFTTVNSNVTLILQGNANLTVFHGVAFSGNGTWNTAYALGGDGPNGSWTPPAPGVPVTLSVDITSTPTKTVTIKVNGTQIGGGSFSSDSSGGRYFGFNMGNQAKILQWTGGDTAGYVPGPVALAATSAGTSTTTANLTGGAAPTGPANPPVFGSIGAISGNTNVCAMPAGITAGDLLLMFHENDGGAVPACTGWTLIGSIQYSAGRLAAFRKFASGSEGSTQTITGGSSYQECVCLRYTLTDPTTPINIFGTTATNATASLTTTSDKTMELACVSYDNGSVSAAAPAGWTRRLDGTGNYNFYVAERTLPTAGPTGTTTFQNPGGTFGTFHIVIAPVPGAAPAGNPVALAGTSDGVSTATATRLTNNAITWVKEVGFVTNNTTGLTSVVAVAAGGVPVGDICIATVSADNTGASGAAQTLAVTDPRGNTWTVEAASLNNGGSANTGIVGWIAWSRITTALVAADNITFTWGTTTVAKAINVQQFHGLLAAGTPVVTQAATSQSATTPLVAATPTLAGQLIVALTAVEGGTADSYTEDNDTVDGTWVTITRRGSGTTTAGATLNAAYKISSGVTAQTYNPTLGTARRSASKIAVFAAALSIVPLAGSATGTSGTTGALTVPAAGGPDLVNMAGWWDASDASTFTLAGSNVSQWRDKSGLTRHLVQASSGSQPVRTAALVNGLAAVQVVTPRFMAFQNSNLITGTTFSFFIVYRLIAIADYGRIMSFWSTSGNGYDWDNDQSVSFSQDPSLPGYGSPTAPSVTRNYSAHGGALTGNHGVLYNTWAVVSVVFDGSTGGMYINGTAVETPKASTGTFDIDNIALATDGVLNGSSTIDVAEILIYSDAKVGAARTAIEGYLNGKWLAAYVPGPVPLAGGATGVATATATLTVPGAALHVTDNFNRANGAITTPWIKPNNPSVSLAQIVGNRIQAPTQGTFYGGIWNLDFGAYQSAQIDAGLGGEYSEVNVLERYTVSQNGLNFAWVTNGKLVSAGSVPGYTLQIWAGTGGGGDNDYILLAECPGPATGNHQLKGYALGTRAVLMMDGVVMLDIDTGPVLDDPFPGAAIDTSKWTVYNRIGDLTNGEVNGVIPANVRVANGSLFIDAKFEDTTIGDSQVAPRLVHYTSGQIASNKEFLYGRVEFRARVTGGYGNWPDLWMLGYGWHPTQAATANDPGPFPESALGEFDIAEYMYNDRTQVNCQIHYNDGSGHVDPGGFVPVPGGFDPTTRFMVYRLDWSAGSAIFSIDPEDGSGFRVVQTVTGTHNVPNTPMYVIVHNAVGGTGGQTPNPATFPQTMEVDYVRG